MEIINTRLISHPMNWVILFFMVFIFVFAVHMVVSYSQADKQQAA